MVFDDFMRLVVLADVEDEMEKSIREKGPLTIDPVRASGILINEASEVMAEALKMTNPAGSASHRSAKGTNMAMYIELIQTANVALMMAYAVGKK